MSKEAEKPGRKPSWRGEGSGKRRVRPEGTRSWRKPIPDGGAAQRGGRLARQQWVRRVGSLVAVLFFAALLVWMIGIPGCLQTELVVVAESAYSTSAFPPNPFADQDATALWALDAMPRVSCTPVRGAVDFSETLQAIDPRKVLVLYLNLLSGRNGQGPYFLPSDANPDDAAGYWNPQPLWEALKDRPKQNKLVILDVTHVPTMWRLGLLENDVLAGLDLEQVTKEIPNLVILCSSSRGERSWTSPDLGANGQSVFGYYLAKALVGDADRDTNQRVSVLELFKYVYVHTSVWVTQNRDPDGQHPRLFPSHVQPDGKLDFDVTAVSQPRDRNPAEGGSEDARQSQLTRLFSLCRKRDDLKSDREPYQYDPLRWRKLTYQLMRAEEWLRARNCDKANEILNQAEKTLAALEQHDSWSRLKEYAFVYENIGRRVTGKGPGKAPLALPEEHLKQTCEEHLPRDGSRQLIPRAVEVRRLGEEAASGPLGTHVWVRNLVSKGDALRRQGEDRLFLGEHLLPNDQQNLRNVSSKLQEAEEYYQKAKATSAAIHKARSVLNRLYAELPDLARWAAFRDPSGKEASQSLHLHRGHIRQAFERSFRDQGNRRQLPDLAELRELDVHDPDEPNTVRDVDNPDKLNAVEIKLLLLFEQARILERHLQFPSQAGVDGETKLSGEPKAAETWLAELERESLAAEKRIGEIQIALRNRARYLESLDPPQPQQVLWRQIRDILKYPLLPAENRKNLSAKLREFASRIQSGYSSPSAEAMDKWAIKEPSASHSGVSRGAWHAFWAIQVLSLGDSDTTTLPHLWRAWHDIWEDEDDVHKQWHQLAALGDGIRDAWVAKRREVRKEVKSSSGDLDRERADLVKMARVARTVHGYDADRLGSADPAAALRHFQVAERCLAHAQRYLDDYWADWYDKATEHCLHAAAASTGLQGSLAEWSKQVEGRLQQRRAAGLRIHSDVEKIVFGSKLSVPVALRVVPVATEGLPKGDATVWLKIEDTKRLQVSDDNKRVPVDSSGGTISFLLRKPDDFDEKNCGPTEIAPQLWFRGHTSRAPLVVQVDACRPPAIVAKYQRAARSGQVVVHGTDRRAILFILDCSYSMRKPLGGSTRFQTAVGTLRGTLRALRRRFLRDRTHRVGLMAFGHRVRILTDGKGITPNSKWPEDKIPKAVRNDPLQDIQLMAEIAPLGDQHFERLNSQLDVLNWWGNTPLLGALDDACIYFKKKKMKGTIVAITDGAWQDNARVMKQLEAELATLRERGIPVDLHIVGFAVEEKDLAVLKQLAEGNRGEFHSAPDGQTLAESLEEAIKPRKYHVKKIDPGGPDSEQDLAEAIDDLSPGDYEVGFPDAEAIRFRILGGEKLVFRLELDRLRHEKFVREPVKRRSQSTGQPGGPNLIGYRRFRIHRNHTAEFLVSLFHEDDSRFVRRPGEIVFQIAPEGEVPYKRRSMDWRLDPDRSIPTWQISVHDWPLGKRARIRAYWKMTRTPPDLPLTPWDEASKSWQIELPDGPQLTVSAEHHEVEGKVVVKINTLDDAVLNPDAVEELANLRVDLGLKGRRFEPRDLSYTSAFRDDGSLIFEFDVGEQFQPRNFFIGITSWKKRKGGASHGELANVRNDEEGI